MVIWKQCKLLCRRSAQIRQINVPVLEETLILANCLIWSLDCRKKRQNGLLLAQLIQVNTGNGKILELKPVSHLRSCKNCPILIDAWSTLSKVRTFSETASTATARKTLTILETLIDHYGHLQLSPTKVSSWALYKERISAWHLNRRSRAQKSLCHTLHLISARVWRVQQVEFHPYQKLLMPIEWNQAPVSECKWKESKINRKTQTDVKQY